MKKQSFVTALIMMATTAFTKGIHFVKEKTKEWKGTQSNKYRAPQTEQVAGHKSTWFHKSFNNPQLIGKLMYFKTKRGKKLYRIISRDDSKRFSYRLQSIEYERAA